MSGVPWRGQGTRSAMADDRRYAAGLGPTLQGASIPYRCTLSV
jgi:hypothetical protein